MAGTAVPAPVTFLQKLQFRPGVNRESTFYSNAGGYWDSSRVRFRDGRPETIGGWQRSGDELQGIGRALFQWVNLDGAQFTSIGTSLKYYARTGGNTYDITPVRDTIALGAAPLATTNHSATVTVTATGHQAGLGDFVTFTGAATTNGIPDTDLNIEHQITSIVDSNTFTIEVATQATSTGTGGGASISADFQLNTGLDAVVIQGGWGAGVWGRDTWGSGTDIATLSARLRLWSQDNWGEDLLFCPRDGGIYYYDVSSVSTRATNVADMVGIVEAPVIASQVMVSSEDRHAIVFACNDEGSSTQDPLLIRWCDAEDLLTWNAAQDNSAGGIRIEMGSEFVRALKTRREILVWTDASLHSFQFIGPPYVFGLYTLSANTSIIGPNAVVNTGDIILWMGTDNFYQYTGQVQPLPCTLKEFVFKNLNYDQRDKIHAGTNKRFNEATFFYPSTGSDEPDRYVTLNYVTGEWYGGALERTAWLDGTFDRYPLACHTDGYVYDHEIGSSDGEQNPPVSLNAYIQTSPLEIGQGDQFMLIRRLLPDITFQNSTASTPVLNVSITGYAYPGGASIQSESGSVIKTVDAEIEQYTEVVPMRLRARSVSFRFSCDQEGVGWRIGDFRMELRPDGKR